jgi:hypothetical protein
MNTAIRIVLSLLAAAVTLGATAAVLWAFDIANNTIVGAATIIALLGVWVVTKKKNRSGNGKPKEPWDVGMMSHHGDSP